MFDLHVDEIATAASTLKNAALTRAEKIEALNRIKDDAEMAEAALLDD